MGQAKVGDPIEEFEQAVMANTSIVGSESVDVVCYAGAHYDFCSGWEETIELTSEVYQQEDTKLLRYPGFEWECPNCGQNKAFYIGDDIEFSRLRPLHSSSTQNTANGQVSFDGDFSDEYA